jgi:hypothetical protein
MKYVGHLVLIGLIAIAPSAARATTLFTAVLNGSQETPPNASLGTGFGTLLLNDLGTLITINLSFSNISAPATASHIHGPGAPGIAAAILFPFAGVPSATSGVVPEQSFAITPTQVAQLQAGLFYFNVHDANFPAGEIRGQISATPEPSSLLLFAASILLILGLRRPRGRIHGDKL